MRSQPQPAEGLLTALADSGRRLLDVGSVSIAAGPSGRLTVRAVAGTEPALVAGTAVTERKPVPDGVLAPVRVSVSATAGIVLGPAGRADPDAYALAGPAGDRRVLLLVGPGRPDERVAGHLLELASALLVAERSAALGMIRDSLHEREQERRRWARELHDETLQQLGALQVLLTSALPKARAAEAAAGGAPCAGLVDAVLLATELVAGQIANLRHLIIELRPAALDDLGLTPPLQALARRTGQLSGLPVVLHVSLRYADRATQTRLLPEIELAVYRVVQEALSNVRRHAAASRATVTVVEDDDVVTAEITDNGQGFDPHRAVGFGLAGMRERAELAGGTLEVTPARPDGTGTTIRLVVPARHR